MDTDSLKLFTETAKAGSFAEVARRLHRDPSQVSRAIAALERSLEVRLFKRSTRKLSLTEAGERYLTRVQPVLEELSFAEEEARALNQRPSGTIRMTASTAFGQIYLLPLLPRFYELYPEIQIELQLSDGKMDLVADDVDIACRLAPHFDSDFVGVKLFETRYYVCASPGYIDNAKPIHEPGDLFQHLSVAMSLPQYRSRWLFKNKNHQIDDIPINTRLIVSNALALRECLLQGMGPGLIANWLVDEHLHDGSLINLFPEYQVTATDYQTAAWLLYPSRKYVAAKTRVMIDFLKDNIAH